jgi:hypothetical protein
VTSMNSLIVGFIYIAYFAIEFILANKLINKFGYWILPIFIVVSVLPKALLSFTVEKLFGKTDET